MDAKHKAWLLRLLSEMVDDTLLKQFLRFKGGTCASMLGFLDRFSVDLDFDILDETKTDQIKSNLKKIFTGLDLEIKNQSPKVLEFVLKYPAPENERNSLRLNIIGKNYKENIYENQLLPEIGRYFGCQTIDTMFANKLVDLSSGRDIYDIHYFFFTGQRFRRELIMERTGKKIPEFLKYLKKFIEKRVTTDLLIQDLGTLLSSDKMRFVKNNLLRETKMFIDNEINE